MQNDSKLPRVLTLLQQARLPDEAHFEPSCKLLHRDNAVARYKGLVGAQHSLQYSIALPVSCSASTPDRGDAGESCIAASNDKTRANAIVFQMPTPVYFYGRLAAALGGETRANLEAARSAV